MTKHEIINNFLPTEEFKTFRDIFEPEGKKLEAQVKFSPSEEAEMAGMNLEQILHYTASKLSFVSIPWTYNSTVAGKQFDDSKTWRLFHMSYIVFDEQNKIQTKLYPHFKPILDRIEGDKLLRIKCNLFPNTEIVYEHAAHYDFLKSHKTALLSINTCDGYTTLEDGTKIDSIENRMLKFDGSSMHKSSTTSNQTVRMNVNISYE
jgi:hypothetical protein